MPSITGILLAGGSSSRFGSNKLLHPLTDLTPLVLNAARSLQSICDETIAVVRSGNETLEQLLQREGLRVVISPLSNLGMGHSVAAGVEASPNSAGWIIALGDMPFIEPSTYQAISTALREGASIAVPMTNGRRGHPIGFSNEWFNQLTQLTGDTGARRLLETNSHKINICEVNDPGIFRDIDVMSDL